MKYSLYILSFFICACNQDKASLDRKILNHNFWVSDSLDYYNIDSASGGGKTMYGSAYLFNLDSGNKVNFLSADFYWKNDSLYLGGEPGRTMKTGNWEIKDSQIVLTQTLIYKMIMLTSDRIGQIEHDSLKIIGNSILNYKGKKLIPTNKLSSELKTLMTNDWANFPNRNGS